jgi:hypothetical protein
MFSEVNMLQENEKSKTAAVSGEEDLITEELRNLYSCSCIITFVMMLQELLTCRVSSVPNQQYVYS